MARHHDVNPAGEFERLTAIVMAAELIAEVHGVEPIDHTGPASRIYQLLTAINLNHTDYYHMLFESRRRLSEAQSFFGIPVSDDMRVKPPAPPPDDLTGKSVAVVSSSSFSADWLGALLKLNGYHPVSVSVFNQSSWHKLKDALFCLIDPNNAEPDALEKLMDRLTAFEKPAAVVDDELPEGMETILGSCHLLSDLITEGDLRELASGAHKMRPSGTQDL